VKHLFITQDYAPDLGGMARRHVELCRRFAPENVIVSTVSAPGADSFDRGESYPIVRQPFAFAGAKVLHNQLRWARWLVRTCRAGIDIVHCGNIRPAGYPALWANARTGTPYLLYVNGGDLLRERVKIAHSRLKRATGRSIFGGAAGIVANSEWTASVASELMRDLGVRHHPPVRSIHLGTDPAFFRPDRDTGSLRRRLMLGDARLLVTIARLVPHKGQDVAIRALASLRKDFPGLRYLIVGVGPDEQRLRALARELGIESAVTFAGALSDDDIAEAYATSTIYLGLSRVEGAEQVEGFGISFSEAAASGIPAVAGDSGGVRSAVREAETGFIVPPNDARAVASAIRTLLASSELRQQMGRAGRRAVETHYNWDRVAEETKAFAHEVLRVPIAR
jgi:phosphatidylinositol alpha-1,6-mannosyltransferase